jgi:hypothetical protein
VLRQRAEGHGEARAGAERLRVQRARGRQQLEPPGCRRSEYECGPEAPPPVVAARSSMAIPVTVTARHCSSPGITLNRVSPARATMLPNPTVAF